ncbi:ABC transporter permease [Streptomyces sp. ACA25]|uniref:ABC transporter permease n=1 Tax=Streptomyces sp. ACA25 TaxID=3022596 RepID=UPI00230706B7|nr:ABC transporter permease [Streptomyces sp. ACA25]MDB1088781.1 ABC transporter permease [Streptomyces sp. ACA25]
MRRHWALFATATRYALIGHARNRFAMLLVVVYIPLWITLAYLAIPDQAAPFRLRATGDVLSPPGNHLTQVTGALNAVTLIAGFMMFAATFTGGAFDRRLAMAGYPRYHLVLAKLSALTLLCAAVAAYATVVISFVWPPQQPFLLAAALFCAALTYGALGVVLGSVLRREVEGMFAILMISILDSALQNPLSSSGSDSAVVRFLPTYGAVQSSMSAAFSGASAAHGLVIQLLWLLGAASAAFLVFRRRTRNALAQERTPGVPPAPSGPATTEDIHGPPPPAGPAPAAERRARPG